MTAGRRATAGRQTKRALRALAVVAVAATGTGASTVAAGPVFPDEDIPTRLPELTWTAPLDCATGGCTATVGHGAVFVLQRAASARVPAGDAEIVAFAVGTGDELWRQTLPADASTVAIAGESVVASSKARTFVLERQGGTVVAESEAALVGVNAFGVIFLDDGREVLAIDAGSGEQLWSRRDGVRVARVCRDLAVLVGRDEPQPIEVVEQYTGRSRWVGEDDYPADAGTVRCGGMWLYVSDGDGIGEFYAADGESTWYTELPGAGRFEFFGEVAIVHADDEVVGIDLWAGDILWAKTPDEIGELVDGRAWLRTNGTSVIKVLPWSGESVAAADPFSAMGSEVDVTAEVEVLDASETRVSVRRGAAVVTLGLNDLGVSWQLDLPTAPEWAQVHRGSLLTIAGDSLAGYRAPPLL